MLHVMIIYLVVFIILQLLKNNYDDLTLIKNKENSRELRTNVFFSSLTFFSPLRVRCIEWVYQRFSL